MGIYLDSVGLTSDPIERSWTSRDAILYALSVGAGTEELSYTTEHGENGSGQQVLPTFALVAGGTGGFLIEYAGDFDPAQVVHGGQSFRLSGPIGTSGCVKTVSRIEGIYDKGTGALVEIVSSSTDAETGEPAFEARLTAFVRGEGGFGGPRGSAISPPHLKRRPDHQLVYATLPVQALMYRLTGDRNRLHSDPTFAAQAGFPKPILHGLCTFGFVGRALLHSLCDSDPSQLVGMDGRFVAPLYPGQELVVSIWEDASRAHFRAERTDGDVVLIGTGYTAE